MLLAFILTVILVPFVRMCAEASGGIDRPDSHRKRQRAPVPRFGGVAIYFSALISLAVLGLFPGNALARAILSGGGIAVLGGVIDDVKNVSPKEKLVFQFLSAIGAVISLENGFAEKVGFLYFLRLIATVIFIVAMMNAFNFTDGVDGLCPSLSLVALVVASVLFRGGAPLLLFFSVLGFLPYNLHSKIYLGESGAGFLGYAAAVCVLYTEGRQPIALVSMAAIPLCELMGTAIRRLVNRKNAFSADRGHIHHILTDAGISGVGTVVILLLSAVAFAAPTLISELF